MVDVVNLNRYRKERNRRATAKTAAENRVRYGRSKAERQQDRREEEKATKDLDNKRID